MAISDIDEATPNDLANAGLGAAQLRQLKADVKECFPAVDGVISNTSGTGSNPPTASDYAGLFTRLAAVETTVAATAGIPYGFIGIWYGLLGTWPTGWFRCDGDPGGLANNTPGDIAGITIPDIEDRFVLAAGTSYAPGSTGGNSGVTGSGGGGSGQTDAHALTVAELPDLSSALQVNLVQGTGVMDHSDGTEIAAGDGASPGQPAAWSTSPIRVNGAAGDGHFHTLSGLSGHTHTQSLPPYWAGVYIIWMGPPP